MSAPRTPEGKTGHLTVRVSDPERAHVAAGAAAAGLDVSSFVRKTLGLAAAFGGELPPPVLAIAEAPPVEPKHAPCGACPGTGSPIPPRRHAGWTRCPTCDRELTVQRHARAVPLHEAPAAQA